MSRNRWIMVAVAGLAGVAFLADRLFLGAPASAQAQTAERQTDQPAGRKARPAVAAKPAPKALEDPALDPLSRLAEGTAARDIFTPSPQMLQFYQTAVASESGDHQKGPPPGSPEAFAAEHQLQATSTGQPGPLAIVDGKMLRLGEPLDGFRLTRIAPCAAEFRRGRDRVTLTIPTPAVTEKAQ